jgi:hypothetical protein
MADIHASNSPGKRADLIRARIQKLEELGHACRDEKAWNKFDTQTEQFLLETFGPEHPYLESYKYAALGEAEALVNMPEGGQEPPSQDIPQKAFQQRRQLLHVILAEFEKLENAGKKP